jgi:hypothetical protein
LLGGAALPALERLANLLRRSNEVLGVDRT